MKNFVQPGKILELTAPYDRKSGEGALIGSIFGVATVDVKSGAKANFSVEGVFELPKAADTIVEGDEAYWDDTAKVVTTDDTGTVLIGAFVEAASSGAATAKVLIR